jgi:hypothetical protein
MKQARITLEIVFDEASSGSPESWDWTELLDMGADESVQVVSYEEDDA